jgi:hypothetical protein
MSLEEKINNDIKASMLAKEKEKLEALRAVKAALLLMKTEKEGVQITEEKENALLQKLVKQRKDAAEIYNTNNRPELAEKELFEASIIEVYLPKKMSNEEIANAVKNIIAQTGVTSASEFGKVMGIAVKQLAGKADNKVISEVIKSLLS